MIRTLRESKAKLSELVEKASRGEDVLITVRGKVKARLTRATPSGRTLDRSAWVRELQALQKKWSAGATRTPVEQILAEIREDRL